MTRWGRFGRENALSYVPRRTSHGSAGTGVDLHCPRLALLDRHTQGDAAAGRPPLAPVAQWIEQRFPKPRAQVRFLSGASPLTEPEHGSDTAKEDGRST